MRDRSLTPFFPLPREERSGTRRPFETEPGRARLRSVPARQLEGKVVGEGRYLLLRKTGHDDECVHFSARDLVGGLEVEVDLVVDGDAQQGYRIGPLRLSEKRPALPDLLPTRDTGIVRRITPARGIWRVLRRGRRG